MAASSKTPSTGQLSIDIDQLAAYQTWLARQPLAPPTRRAYLSRTRLYWAFLQTQSQTSSVDYGDPLRLPSARDFALRDFKTYLKIVRHAKPSSVNLTLAALDHFYGFLGMSKALLSREVLERTAPRALEPEQQKHLLRVLQTQPSLRDRALATLLLYTGLRAGECVALDLEDVVLSERNGRLIVRSGKGNAYREVPLNRPTRQILQEWKVERNKKFTDPALTAFFVSRQAQRLSPRALDLRLRRLALKAGLTFSAHTLRHTCLTNLVRKGHDLVLVAEIAGHKRLETTRRYSLPSLADRERAMQSLEVDY